MLTTLLPLVLVAAPARTSLPTTCPADGEGRRAVVERVLLRSTFAAVRDSLALTGRGPADLRTLSDTSEAREWAELVAASFLGGEEENLEFRQATGLERVDSTAVIGAITDPAICSAIASALQTELAAQGYPYRLVSLEIGPYYVVAAIDTTPPPEGVIVSGRTLVFVLAKTDLSFLVDNWLM